MWPKAIVSAFRQARRRFWADLPLRIKGLVVVAIPLIALLASTASFYRIQRDDREADTWVERTAEVANWIQGCLTHPLNWELASEEFARLDRLLRDQPSQLRQFRHAQQFYRDNCGAPADLIFSAGPCQASANALQATLRAMRVEQEKLLVARVQRVAQVRLRALVVVVGTGLLGLCGGLLAGMLFTSGIARRVERLQKNAGLLQWRLPMLPRLGGRDEIGSLEEALEIASDGLRRSEEERDRFFSLSLDMLCIVSLDGSLKRVNPAFTNTLGHPEAVLLDSSLLELIHPEDRERTAARMRELASGNPVACLEIRLLCRDGSYKWLAWSIAPFLADGLAYAVARDQTRQKQDEEALRQSGARLASVLESITEGFFTVDRDHRLTCVNPEAERIWMHSHRGVLGHDLWEVFPENVDGPFHRIFGQALQSGKAAHVEEYLAPAGRWFEVHAYPSAEGLSVYFRDITERRKADERVRRALKEKEVLLREIHHRVKNNLQVICSLLRLQERYLQDEMLRQVLKDCRERVHAMAILHDQLHRAKDLSSIDLGEYFRNLAASLFCSYGVNSAEIGLRLNLEAITASIDLAIPCGLIVHELVSNAVQHAFPGGRTGHVSIGLRAQPGGEIEVSVADDGAGFVLSAEPEDRPSLGLRLVDLLAEQIGAAVERSSDAGTRYRLVFKLKNKKESESHEEASHHVG
jgi:PAS domain S-box-containing protein